MQIKKSGGKIFGAIFTASEQKAIDMEIQRQLADYDKKHADELDSMILWQLHEQLGFGPKRLKRFYKNFAPAVEELRKRYEIEDSDQVWLCTRKLKEYGIDLEKLRNER